MNTYIRRLTIVTAFAAIIITAAACGDSNDQKTQRTIDVEALTYEDVQQRALDAVTRDGHVYHVVVTSQFREDPGRDVWLYLEGDAARTEARGGEEDIRITYGSRIAWVMNERFFDAPCQPCSPHIVAMAAPHLGELFVEDARDVTIEEGVIDGEPTIKVSLTHEYGGDYTGDVEVTLHLDESFLPVELHRDPPGPLPEATITFENEFVARDTLAAEFFSPDALKALAAGPTADLDAAVAAGLDVFWLGETFEEMILRDESSFESHGISDDGLALLHLSYGPADSATPSPCAFVRAHPAGERAAIPDGAIDIGTVDVAGETATVYRVEAPIPPGGSRPVVGDAYAALIETEDTMVEVLANCGPEGTNVYRTEEGFRRLLASLTRYETGS